MPWIDAPTGLSPYVPKWARDPGARRPWPPADSPENTSGWAQESIGGILARAGDPLRPEWHPYVNRYLERSLRPAIVPPPARAPTPLSAMEILCGSIIGMAAGFAITLFTIGKVPPAAGEVSDHAPASFAARFEAAPEQPL